MVAMGDFRKASAVRQYRIHTPLDAIQKAGLGKCYVTDPVRDQKVQGEIMLSADILIQWFPADEDSVRQAACMSKLTPLRQQGKWIYPPLYVMDADDSIEFVRPFNDTFAVYGIRDWNGRWLQPGDKIEWENADGSKMVLWEDLVTPNDEGKIFDIAMNWKRVGWHYDAARLAAGVTVSTEILAKLYRDQGVKEIYVYPNSVTTDGMHWPELQPHEGVRILWEGGSSHMDSWLHTRKPFIECLKRYPQAKLVSFGHYFPWMEQEIPPEQLEIHRWVDHHNYQLKRACLDPDITFCPIADAPFTRCKSAIRFYEASIGPRPQPCLAARVGPYLEIEDGVTGLLYSNDQEMVEKLGQLIEDALLRKRLADEAQKWVMANREASVTVKGLFDFYQYIKTEQRKKALMP